MDYAAGKGYQVTPFPLRSSKGFTVMLDGQFHIALADDLREEEKAPVLAHEIGHCETASLYTRNASREERAEMERRADEWAAAHGF